LGVCNAGVEKKNWTACLVMVLGALAQEQHPKKDLKKKKILDWKVGHRLGVEITGVAGDLDIDRREVIKKLHPVCLPQRDTRHKDLPSKWVDWFQGELSNTGEKGLGKGLISFALKWSQTTKKKV